MKETKPLLWKSKINNAVFDYDIYKNIENDKLPYKTLPKDLYPYTIIYSENNIKRNTLNNYTKSFENFYFWFENEELIIKLYQIENNKVVNIINDKGKSFFKVDNNINPISFDDLLYHCFSIKNKNNFIKIYNKYIRSHSEKYKVSDDEFPLDFDTMVELSNLDDKIYDIKLIITELLDGKEITDFDLYKKDEVALNHNIIKTIIDENINKFADYRNGKTGIANMFFGLYLKQIDSSKVDKEKLLIQIKDFMDNYVI